MGYWGSPDPQIFVRKVLSMAGIQSAVWAASLSATLTWSKQSEGAGSRERCPQPRLTPPHRTHLLWSSVSPCRQPGTARTPSGYIQKWVVQRDLRGRVRAAGKPSDEPLRKGETQSPEAFHMNQFHEVTPQWIFFNDTHRKFSHCFSPLLATITGTPCNRLAHPGPLSRI